MLFSAIGDIEGLGGMEKLGWGEMYVYIWLICLVVQQKLIQPCKATIPQFKKTKKSRHAFIIQNNFYDSYCLQHFICNLV